MRTRLLIFVLIMSASLASSQSRQYFQLKIYEFVDERQEQRTDQFLRKAFLPGLKKQGVSNIGVFKNRKDLPSDSIRKTYVLIPYDELGQMEKVEKQLTMDKDYRLAGSDYLTAGHGDPPYARIENIWLLAFEDMPKLRPTQLSGSRKDRVYELRSYESPTEAYFKNKVEMFNEGGEIVLFDQLEFNAVFYGEVLAGPSMPNLMYMTTFSDQKSRDDHWQSFRTSPVWENLKSMEKYKNNVSKVDIYFLYPTDYSDY